MSKATLQQRLLKITSKISNLKKDGGGGYLNYKYVTPKKLLDNLRPLLAEQEVFFSQSVSKIHEPRREEHVNSKGKIIVEYLYLVEFLMTFSCGDESLAVKWAGAGCNGKEKGIGSAGTYAQRMFLLNFFLIPTSDDPDQLAEAEAEAEAGQAKPKEQSKSEAVRERMAKLLSVYAPNYKDKWGEWMRNGKKSKSELLGLTKVFISIVKVESKLTIEQLIERYSTFKTVKGDEKFLGSIEELNKVNVEWLRVIYGAAKVEAFDLMQKADDLAEMNMKPLN